MSYTFCEDCQKVLWWDAVEYEEIDGLIYCFDCTAECEKCGAIFHDEGETLCESCKDPVVDMETEPLNLCKECNQEPIESGELCVKCLNDATREGELYEEQVRDDYYNAVKGF
jgi:hypothetical protein